MSKQTNIRDLPFKQALPFFDVVPTPRDVDYAKLRQLLQDALDVPRIDMPVIEPDQVESFIRLADAFFSTTGKGSTLESLLPVSSLKPTQGQIWLEKVVSATVEHGVPTEESMADQTLIVSSDFFIIDGHHRYAQCFLFAPDIRVPCVIVPLPIESLLDVAAAFSDAVGNVRKAYMNRKAKASVPGLRQETQFTCCATSIAACLHAHGKPQTEADVNRILGAAPMAGASWESILATVQYFGLRGSLVVPATVSMLKAWTDAGTPVIIGWNPENRPWSHASVVADVTEGPDGRYVHVMDPNIPNPDKTFRVVHEDEFCAKWGEKVSDGLIMRRPACAVEREVTVDGRQVRASVHAKLDRKTKSFIGSAFNRAGLDGNGRFQKPEKGFVAAVDILSEFGIELDDVPNSHLFSPRPSGTLKLWLAYTNDSDPFSPTPIQDSMLILSYHEVAPDRFEVLAYMS